VAVLRAAWPVMRKAGYGRIVNTSSGSVLGLPWSFGYQATKAAIIGLTRALALDGAAHNIKVNAVSPIAWTQMTSDIPDQRFRDFLAERFPPECCAPFVAALVSESVPCSGELFSVGGGVAARVFLAVIQAQAGSESLTEDEMFGALVNLLFAGHDTTRFQFGWLIYMLLTWRDQWERLVAEPSLAPGAVEESMRLTPSLRIVLRRADEDVEYRGVVFPAGTLDRYQHARHQHRPGGVRLPRDVRHHPEQRQQAAHLRRRGTPVPRARAGPRRDDRGTPDLRGQVS
jgi:hypothetical protein